MTTGNAPTIEFKEFRRKQIAELADWCEGFDMTGVSVSDADKQAGSPKIGDKIARNPKNHADRWLVAADYFADNFEPVEKLAALESQPVPVEPAVFIHETYAAETREVEQHEVVLKSDYDTLQSALRRVTEERDAKDRLITNYEEWLSVSGENAKELQERAEKAETKLAALEKPVPVEPDYWNKLGKEHYWENEARRYAGNSDYWRERAEKAESELKLAQEERDKWKAEADGQFQYAGRLLEELHKAESLNRRMVEQYRDLVVAAEEVIEWSTGEDDFIVRLGSALAKLEEA